MIISCSAMTEKLLKEMLSSNTTKLTFLFMAMPATVMPTRSDSDVILCLQLLGKTLKCTLHLSQSESIDHLCINPIHTIISPR